MLFPTQDAVIELDTMMVSYRPRTGGAEFVAERGECGTIRLGFFWGRQERKVKNPRRCYDRPEGPGMDLLKHKLSLFVRIELH